MTIGYHLYEIQKGTIGDFSKIIEEFLEFKDAIEQQSSIMALTELSDLVGAIEFYYQKNNSFIEWTNLCEEIQKNKNTYHVDFHDLLELFSLINSEPDFQHQKNKLNLFVLELNHFVKQYNMELTDLIKMNKITQRAFKNGRR